MTMEWDRFRQVSDQALQAGPNQQQRQQQQPVTTAPQQALTEAVGATGEQDQQQQSNFGMPQHTDSFPLPLDRDWHDGGLSLLDSFPGGPASSGPSCANQGSKRQRAEQGEASVDAYLAQLGHDPQHQLLQQQHTGVMPDLDGLSGGCDSGAAAGGHGSLVAAMRTRSLTTFDDDLDEDSPAGPAGMRGRRGEGSNPSKAHRERARRERLNDGFAELAALLEVGKVVRTDKLSIIADAVKEVTKLRAESHQLRQLNKFLEDRVKDLEAQKGHGELHRMMQASMGGVPGSGAVTNPFGGFGGMVAVPAAALHHLSAMGGPMMPPQASSAMAQSLSHLTAGAALLQQAEQPSEQQQQQQQPTAVPQSPEPAGAQVVQNGSGGDLQPHPHSSAQTPPSQAHLQPPSRQAGLTQQQQQQQLQEQMQMQQHQAQLQLQQLHQQAVVHAASSTALGGVPHVNPQLLGSLLPAPPNAGSQAPQQAGPASEGPVAHQLQSATAAQGPAAATDLWSGGSLPQLLMPVTAPEQQQQQQQEATAGDAPGGVEPASSAWKLPATALDTSQDHLRRPPAA